MDVPNVKRCPHYQLSSEPLEMEGPASYLAVRRCLLTERMIGLLRQSQEGAALADKLVVNVANTRSFAFVGPDLEAVTQQSCAVHRCEESCTPGYAQHLALFQITDPREHEVTCSDEAENETRSETVARLTAQNEETPVALTAPLQKYL
jgi:hypothetical protein